MAAELIRRRRTWRSNLRANLTLISLFFLLQEAACTLIGNCASNECSNGGSCIQRDSDSEVFECACTSDWSGPHCNLPNVQPVAGGNPTVACSSSGPSSCWNGGTCQNILGKFVCICDVQWQGSNCEQLRDGSTAPISIGCGNQEFKCNNGACILNRLRCDGGRDCLDGSDEKSCSALDISGMFSGCKPWEFNCRVAMPMDIKNCIPVESRCDQIIDCVNGADEYGCGYPIPAFAQPGVDLPPISDQCGRLEYLCDDGHCIIGRARCDGNRDCRDGSDENNCASIVPNPLCSTWEFDCGDGSCIHRGRHCDGFADCQNESDEVNCRTLAGIGGNYPGGKLPSEEQPPPGTPIHPPGNSLNLVDILIVSCAMLMAFVAITIFVYLRRVRRMHQRYFAAVAGSPSGSVTSGSRHRQYRQQQGTPYRLSHHSTFCHHLPPHRCPASTNLLVSYNLHTGAQVVGRSTAAAAGAAAADKDDTDCPEEVPPTYSEVVGTSGTWIRDGSVTPPPAYEDLPSAFRH